jgi:hypothetical protein
MRYRALSASGDYTFGQGTKNFLVNSPDAVAQAVITRLKLLAGEWFLDITEGTPYSTEVLGTGTRDTYDEAVRDRILGTEGVLEITGYSSTYSGETRNLTVSATISTIYGETTIQQVL